MFGIIYCVTNTVSGKQYVGQTTYPLEVRWRYHLKSTRGGSTCALHCAIRKYGAESFKFEQLDVAESQDELNEREIHHVARLGTYGGGYNLTPGGKVGTVSEETRRKHSEAQKKVMSFEENRRRISEVQKGRVASEETRKKMSHGHRNSNKVRCLRGHLFDEINAYICQKTGKRLCLTCHYLRHGRKLPVSLQPYIISQIVVAIGGN
jgi:group I intron endonuclease